MTFNAIFTLVEKNLKLFFRSKISSIIIILMPVLIILLAGHGFSSNNLSGISIGTYSSEYSDTTENILQGFEENTFLIRKHNSLEDCINSVQISKDQICILFPKDLSKEGNHEEVIFYVDYSRTNLAYTLINIVNEKVSFESENIGTVLIQELIDNLNSVKDSLMQKKQELEHLNIGLNDAEKLQESIESPISDLEKTISDLENFENSSSIEQEISDLKSIKEKIENNSESLNKLDLKNNELTSSLNLILNQLDITINSLTNLEIGKAENIISPIEVKMEPITPKNSKREYLITSIIALISLFGGILISSTFVLKNKKTLAYFRNFVTPTSDSAFIFSNYLTCIIILILQFALVFAGLYFIFDMNFFSLELETLLILILGWSSFIFIGMFIGYAFKSEETITFSAVLIAGILMFFSNLILPLENISTKFLKFASLNPFVALENSLKKVYLFNLNINSLLPEIIIFIGVSIFFYILTYISRKLTKRIL